LLHRVTNTGSVRGFGGTCGLTGISNSCNAPFIIQRALIETVREPDACNVCTGEGMRIGVVAPLGAVQMSPVAEVVSHPPLKPIAGVAPETASWSLIDWAAVLNEEDHNCVPEDVSSEMLCAVVAPSATTVPPAIAVETVAP
jgi:hypothetical protein